MASFWKTYKGYIAHAAAAAVLAFAPGMPSIIAAYPKWSAALLLVWGWLLHWADGQKTYGQ